MTKDEQSSAVPVLMYHSVSSSSSAAFRPYTVSARLFALQMNQLAQTGYTTMTMSELSDRRARGETVPARTVVITIDDAFGDFMDNVVPVLLEVGFTATLYVPTGYVGGTSRWLIAEGEQRRALLGWRELAQIADLGIECGGHSHSHPQMDLIARRSAIREVALSKALLEDHIQQEIRSFAYPFGYSSPAVRGIVEDLGFSNACVVRDLTSDATDDKFAVPRLTVTPDFTPARLEELLIRPRGRRDVVKSSVRGSSSRLLRTARLKKRENAPSRAPRPPTVQS